MELRRYCAVSGVLFALVAAAHLLRILLALPIRVDAYVVPMSISWIGFVVPLVLAIWAFRTARGTRAR